MADQESKQSPLAEFVAGCTEACRAANVGSLVLGSVKIEVADGDFDAEHPATWVTAEEVPGLSGVVRIDSHPGERPLVIEGIHAASESRIPEIIGHLRGAMTAA